MIIFIASVIFIFAYYLSQKDELYPHERMKKSLLIFASAAALIILASQIFPGTSVKTANEASAKKTTEQIGNLTWYFDKDEAYAEALKTNKNVFIDFHANWCTNCKAFQSLTQSDKELNLALGKSILLKIYDTSPLFEVYKSDKRFPELKIGLPFFIITNAKENLLFKTNDFTQTQNMELFLEN